MIFGRAKIFFVGADTEVRLVNTTAAIMLTQRLTDSTAELEELLGDTLKKTDDRDRLLNKTQRLLLALDADYPNDSLDRFQKRLDILAIQSRKEEELQLAFQQSMRELGHYCLNKSRLDTQIDTASDHQQTYIYVLKCEMGKYYVGQTRNIAQRFIQHKQGHGAVWTSLNPPISLIECVLSTDVAMNAGEAELLYTKKYMCEYGFDNVRGAAYSQVILSEAQKQKLQQWSNE